MKSRVTSLRFRLSVGTILLMASSSGVSAGVSGATGFAGHGTCESLFVSSVSSIFESTPNVVAKIVEGLQETRVTDALNPKECSAFTNACSLATVTVGVEVVEQLNGASPTSREMLKSEAKQTLSLLRTVTEREKNGLSLGETLGLLKFRLAARGQDLKTTTRIERVDELSDLALAANEMMLVATQAGGGHHMVLMFEQIGSIVRAVDPMTGKIESYRLVQTPFGNVRMVSLTNPVGVTSVMDIVGAIRISQEVASTRQPILNSEARKKTERLIQQTQILRTVIEEFDLLLPKSPKSRFRNIEEARNFVRISMANLATAKNFMNVDLDKLNSADEGLVFELQLAVAELEVRVSETGFLERLQHFGLMDAVPAAKAVAAPKWDAKMLEARASTGFKSMRASAIERVETLLRKPSLSSEDFNFNLSRLIQQYSDLVLLAASEVQASDAHRLVTPYFERLDKLLRSRQVDSERHAPMASLFFEINEPQWIEIRKVRRTKFGLDGP